MDPNILRTIAEQASLNYEGARGDIDKVKSALELNRKGQVQLSEIQTDMERWNNRMSRAGRAALERINGTVDFQEIATITKMLKLSESVCKVNVRDRYRSRGSGTGFLIAPDLLITNNHVLDNPEMASYSTAQFNYELDALGNPEPTHTFRLDPDRFFLTSSYQKVDADPYSGLDFTVVAVQSTSAEGKRITDIPYCQLDGQLGKVVDGEGCVIIQHPRGDFKKIVLKDIRALICKEHFLIYESDTLPGSSGSMVIGLGTGEVVALHHSGVPRKNRHGQWLRKDGSVAQPGDADDLIDWIGNEGIRISSILAAVAQINLPSGMDQIKNQLLEGHPIDSQWAVGRSERGPSSVPSPQPSVGGNQFSDEQVWTFEIELSTVVDMQEDWKRNTAQLVSGLISVEPLYPLSTDEAHKRFYYLTVRSEENPWEISATLEALPQVATCTPDLPMLTDIRPGHYPRWQNGQESFESFNDGTASWQESEDDFRTRWIYGKMVKDAVRRQDAKVYRAWNRRVVNNPSSQELKRLSKNLEKIDLVQIDTGYDDHAKVLHTYNLNKDEDFIDGEDARDEFSRGPLRQPGHGGRTASIIVGNHPEDSKASGDITNDGNYGLLVDAQGNLGCKVIPYRVAQSVVLLNRGRNLFDAALQAIDSGADIIFMCMGSYPRPMLYSIAKTAYERGVIWICAAGNEVESVVAPAMYPGTIAVAASNPDNRPWKGSSYGQSVDIAAPGEDVYVPFRDRRGRDIMAFGSGTSYATPHVAAAAALWKAKHYDDLKTVNEQWQIVERFRFCLCESASTAPDDIKIGKNRVGPSQWDERYGSGILNIDRLLDDGIYQRSKKGLQHAYRDQPSAPHWDLGVRELVHFLWGTLRRKLTPGVESYMQELELSERADISLGALRQSHAKDPHEVRGRTDRDSAEEILRTYFESFAAN